MPVWIALIVIACWFWRDLRLPAAIVTTIYFITDWIMLGLLPRQQRSWGPVTPPLLGLTLLRMFLSLAGAFLVTTSTGLLAMAAIQALISTAAFYATWVEPFRVRVTQLRYTPAQWQGQNMLRILHISDLHFEGMSPREQAVLDYARQLKPDLILLTGDYLNLSSVYDPEAQQGARHFLKQLKAPLGVYAVTGSPVVDREGIVPEIFNKLKIRWLNDETASIRYQGNELWLLGVRCTYAQDRDLKVVEQLVEKVPRGAFTILLYHTPDLMPSLASSNVNLYLCGHTHGGQIRLPMYGAIATSSKWGKRYEMGLYREGKTTLYVSRGLGMEGLGAPRARFLAQPEIVLLTLGSEVA